MASQFGKKSVILASLLGAPLASQLAYPVHPALALDPGAAPTPIALKEAPKPYQFKVSRASDGTITFDFASFRRDLEKGIAEKNKRAKPPLPLPTMIRVFVDNEATRDLPFSANDFAIRLDPTEQYSVRLEAITAEGRVIERTEHFILEKKEIRAVNPESYAGEAALVLRSPLDAEYGIDPEMPEVVQKIGRRKIVFLWKNPEDPRVKSLVGHVDFRVVRDARGNITGYRANDARRAREKLAPLEFKPEEAFVKVDAAFNENSFLWDDMFTCLHTLTFDPDLCRSTLEFWLNVQKLHSQGLGDIPREVLKSNGTSYNLYEVVHLGEVIPNGSYANPNFLGDVAEQLIDQEGWSPANRALAQRVVESMRDYASWLDAYRTVKENGKVVGYWISDLGSGMDNIGRAPGDNFSSVGYVDELARRSELEKSSARLEARLGNFSAMKKHEAKAEELDRLLNDRYWSPEKKFYFDLVPGAGGNLVRQEKMPTVAGFWPLFSRSASPEQMKQIAEAWYTADTFGGTFPVRSLPPVMETIKPGSYFPMGGYWRGGNWPPTDIIKAWGEERSGRPALAAETILRKLRADTYVSNQAVKTLGRKTVYETLGTDKNGNPIPGVQVEPDGRVHETRKDFVGWGGTPHSHGKLRHVLGIRPVAAFGGNARQRERWIQAMTQGSAFRYGTYFGENPDRKLPEQRKLFSEGYLEIAPSFSLEGRAFEVQNYHYRGQPISLKVEMPAEPNGKREVKITVAANGPAEFNMNFVQLRAPTDGPSTASAATRLVKVKLPKAGTKVFNLPLRPTKIK